MDILYSLSIPLIFAIELGLLFIAFIWIEVQLIWHGNDSPLYRLIYIPLIAWPFIIIYLKKRNEKIFNQIQKNPNAI